MWRSVTFVAVDGDEFRRLRKEMALTQGALAEHLGVDRVTITRWETGVHRVPEPAARLLERLQQEAKAKKRKKQRCGGACL